MVVNQRIILFAVLALLLSACASNAAAPTPTAAPTAAPTAVVEVTAAPEATPASTSGLQPATIGDDEGGPVAVEGQFSYTNSQVAAFYALPTPLLFNVSRELVGDFSTFTPSTGQILGVMTSPLVPSPASYRVALPIEPAGPTVDLDNNGRDDAGVQVYTLLLSTVLTGDSYVSVFERDSDQSYLVDPLTRQIREGTLLVYAPDAGQGFPSSAGADGVYFTGDDPAVALPAGYTLATLGADGTVSFTRPRLARMDTIEPPTAALASFADQGILESFDSLIDLLSKRYAYTELRGLDWEQIRQEYRPRIEAADRAGDMGAYLVALNELALGLNDFHVAVTVTDPAPKAALNAAVSGLISGNVGAGVRTLSDGRVIVYFVDPKGPAAAAGWQFGTEILSVQGQAIDAWIASRPLLDKAATPERLLITKQAFAFAAPLGESLTVEYRQPGESETRSVSLTAGAYQYFTSLHKYPTEQISSTLVGGRYGYIQWRSFMGNLRYKIAYWENFLEEARDLPGIVIDMRGNGGGSVSLADTLSSYLFSADAPGRLHWYNTYVYDEAQGQFVRVAEPDYPSSSPRPELTYSGKVVVLVDERTGSSAEYFTQGLQSQQRALVVGQSPSAGGGGNPETIPLPGTIGFMYTKQRTTWPGSQEPNLEGRGVQPDVLVPVSEETLETQLAGGDPVLDAAIELLSRETQ